MKKYLRIAGFLCGFLVIAAASAQTPAPWMPSAPELTFVETTSPMLEVRADESDIKLRKFGLGAEYRVNMVPEFFLNLFLRAAHPVQSSAYGLKFIYRTKNTDVIFKGMYWDIQAPDGNWLGINKDWDSMEYVEFVDFRFAWGQVNVVWNEPLITGLYFIYGFGVGAGAVMGDIYTTPAYGCNADNWREPSSGGCVHLPNSPEREKEDVPRVMAALEATMGLRYDLLPNLSFKLETGLFIPGFWHVTGSVEFLF